MILKSEYEKLSDERDKLRVTNREIGEEKDSLLQEKEDMEKEVHMMRESMKEISDEKRVSEMKLKSTIVVKTSKCEKLEAELSDLRKAHDTEIAVLKA
jgi:predicted nuclease with TOPRIM domain